MLNFAGRCGEFASGCKEDFPPEVHDRAAARLDVLSLACGPVGVKTLGFQVLVAIMSAGAGRKWVALNTSHLKNIKFTGEFVRCDTPPGELLPPFLATMRSTMLEGAEILDFTTEREWCYDVAAAVDNLADCQFAKLLYTVPRYG